MVRTYKKKTNRGQWSEKAMKNAVNAVIQKKMGYMLAAKTFSVPQTTLERKVKLVREKVDASTGQTLKIRLGPKDKVFSDKEERDLCNYMLNMESSLILKDLRVLAYKLAVKNKIPHPFNNEKQEAGKDWAINFLKRHPELRTKLITRTCARAPVCAADVNKHEVDQFFNFLGNVYDEHKLTPDRIYSCCETCISIEPKIKSKIIAKRGRKLVGAFTSTEEGTTITVELCFSASGQHIPPMMVFPMEYMDPQLMRNAAPGSWGVYSQSGCMTPEIFASWLKKFVELSKATLERPVLLLLDDHGAHTQNFNLINDAWSHGVIIWFFPPYTIHRLQVIDDAYIKLLSAYYDHQVSAWLCSHPGMIFTVRQVAKTFGKAFIQASSMSTVVNCFKKCGILPYDPTAYTKTYFAPFSTTDSPDLSTSPKTDTESTKTKTEPLTETTHATKIAPIPNTAAIATLRSGCSTSFLQLDPLGIKTEPLSETIHATTSAPILNTAAISTLGPGCATSFFPLDPFGIKTEPLSETIHATTSAPILNTAAISTLGPGCATSFFPLDPFGIKTEPLTETTCYLTLDSLAIKRVPLTETTYHLPLDPLGIKTEPLFETTDHITLDAPEVKMESTEPLTEITYHLPLDPLGIKTEPLTETAHASATTPILDTAAILTPGPGYSSSFSPLHRFGIKTEKLSETNDHLSLDAPEIKVEPSEPLTKTTDHLPLDPPRIKTEPLTETAHSSATTPILDTAATLTPGPGYSSSFSPLNPFGIKTEPLSETTEYLSSDVPEIKVEPLTETTYLLPGDSLAIKTELLSETVHASATTPILNTAAKSRTELAPLFTNRRKRSRKRKVCSVTITHFKLDKDKAKNSKI